MGASSASRAPVGWTSLEARSIGSLVPEPTPASTRGSLRPVLDLDVLCSHRTAFEREHDDDQDQRNQSHKAALSFRSSRVSVVSLELRDLERAIGKLPPEQRQVILLVGLEGMAYEEVAAVLDVPVGTVRSRLSRGRDQLRRLMGVDADDSERLDAA